MTLTAASAAKLLSGIAFTDHSEFLPQLGERAQIWVVGGGVRDHLLDKQPNDYDWVVVHSSPERMEAAGFLPIRASKAPVFRHPKTREEYALARREAKSGSGYHGFRVRLQRRYRFGYRPRAPRPDSQRHGLEPHRAIAVRSLRGHRQPERIAPCTRLAMPSSRTRCGCCAPHAMPQRCVARSRRG